jgi:recombinational DNA repair protein RecT
MTADEVNGVATRSRSKDRNGNLVGPWATDTGEMWRKTALRRLSKRLPRSDASAKVDAVLDSFDQDFDIVKQPEQDAPAEVPKEMPKALQAVAGASVEETTYEGDLL